MLSFFIQEKIEDRFRDDDDFEHLRVVMLEFAREVFKTNDQRPRYDDFDRLITNNIQQSNDQPEPAVFSWLDKKQRAEAIKDLADHPPATAKDIKEPKAEFMEADYAPLGYEYFEDKRKGMALKAKINHEIFLKKKKGIKPILQNIASVWRPGKEK